MTPIWRPIFGSDPGRIIRRFRCSVGHGIEEFPNTVQSELFHNGKEALLEITAESE